MSSNHKFAHIPHSRRKPKTREIPEQLRDDYVQPTPAIEGYAESKYTGEVEGTTEPEAGVVDEDLGVPDETPNTVELVEDDQQDGPVDDIAAEEEAEATAFETPMKYGDVDA